MDKKIKTTKKQKLLLIIIPVFVLFVTLEFLAHLSGFLYTHFQHKNFAPDLSHPNEFRIMALGESTTAIGFGNSWPMTLERHLNNLKSEKKYVVINEGVSGTDTQKILNTLEEKISKYRPHMIITMMGINDYWNLIKNGQQKKEVPSILDHSKILKFFRLFLVNLKNKQRIEENYLAEVKKVNEFKKQEIELQKLIKENPYEANAYLRLAEFQSDRKLWAQALESYQRAKDLGSNMDGEHTNRNLGLIHLNLNQRDLAKMYYDLSLAKNPIAKNYSDVASSIFYDNHMMNLDLVTYYAQKALDNNPTQEERIHLDRLLIEVYTLSEEFRNLDLARKYFNDLRSIPHYDIDAYLRFSKLTVRNHNYKESIQVLEEGKEKITQINPIINHMGLDEVWQQLIISYDLDGQTNKANETLKKAKVLFKDKVFRRVPDKKSYHAFLESKWVPTRPDNEIYSQEVTRHNYLKIADTISKHKIIHVAMQYPNRDANPLREMLKNYPEIKVIDNYSTFKNALTKMDFEDLFVDHFGGDTGHFTALGSELVAKQIVSTFQQNKILAGQQISLKFQ